MDHEHGRKKVRECHRECHREVAFLLVVTTKRRVLVLVVAGAESESGSL